MPSPTDSLIRVIASINDYASTYHASVEDSAHAFLKGAQKELPPSVIDYLKNMLCTSSISNEDWTEQLLAAGCPLEDIRPFDQIQLNEDYPTLKQMIQDYIKNPNHRPHTMYQAIQHCIRNYHANPHFETTIEVLASQYQISAEKAQQWFIAAYKNQQTMTPLASYLNISAREFQIEDTLYYQAANRIGATSDILSKKYTEEGSLIVPYFEDKAEELVRIASEQKDINQFQSNLSAELLLLDLCGTDKTQQKKTIGILSDNPIQSSSEHRTLAGIQKIQQLAQNHQKAPVDNYFDGRAEAAAWQAMLPEFEKRCYFQITRDALQAKLPPPQKIDSFELFPGVKLVDVLEEAAIIDENRTMLDILNEAIRQRNPVQDNKIVLDSISRLYRIKIDKVQSLFAEALKGQTSPEIPLENQLVQSYLNSKLPVSASLNKLAIVQQQLTSLLANNPQVLSSIPLYIEGLKQKLIFIAKTGDTAAFEAFSNSLNIVNSIGDMLEGSKDFSKKLKRAGEQQRNISLFAECLRALKAESPEKVAAIQTALTVVLTDTPGITFDKIVLQMRDPALDKKSPIGKLKKEMGAHRNVFYWFASLFYPIETKTMAFFREKIQEQILTDQDLGLDPIDPSPTNKSKR